MNVLNKNLCYYYTGFFNFIIEIYLYIHAFIKKFILTYFNQPCIDEIVMVNEHQIISSNKLRGKKKINVTDLYNLFKITSKIRTFMIIKYYYNEQYYRFILNYNIINLLYNHIPNKQIFPFKFDNNIKCPDIISIEIKNENIDTNPINITEFIMSFIGPHINIYPIPYCILFENVIKTLSIGDLLIDDSTITLMDSNLETHILSFDAKLKMIENHK